MATVKLGSRCAHAFSIPTRSDGKSLGRFNGLRRAEGGAWATEITVSVTKKTVWATEKTVWATVFSVAQTVNGLLGHKKGPRERALYTLQCKDNTKSAEMQMVPFGHFPGKAFVKQCAFPTTPTGAALTGFVP